MGAIIHQLVNTNCEIIVEMINTSVTMLAEQVDSLLDRIGHVGNKLAGSLMGESRRHGMKSFGESC